jgi:hypothetical protein
VGQITAYDTLLGRAAGQDIAASADLLYGTWRNRYPGTGAATATMVPCGVLAGHVGGVRVNNPSALAQAWYLDELGVGSSLAQDSRATLEILDNTTAGAALFGVVAHGQPTQGGRNGYLLYGSRGAGTTPAITFFLQSRVDPAGTLSLGNGAALSPMAVSSVWRLWLAARKSGLFGLVSTDGGNYYQLQMIGMNGADPTPPLLGKGPGVGGLWINEPRAVPTDSVATAQLRDLVVSTPPDAALTPGLSGPGAGFVANLYQGVLGTSYNVILIGNNTNWQSGQQLTSGTVPTIDNSAGTLASIVASSHIADAATQSIRFTLNAGGNAGACFINVPNGTNYDTWRVVLVPAATVAVLVWPKSDLVQVGGARVALRPVVIGDATAAGVTWSITSSLGGDGITPAGVYTSGPQTGSAGIQAASAATGQSSKYDTAALQITPQTPPSISISPTTLQLPAGALFAFSYTLNNPSNSAGVVWSAASGPNQITSNGLYTAPASGSGTYPIQDVVTVADAQVGSLLATCAVTVVAAVAVTLTPATVSVVVGQSVQFTASVTGATNTAVLWSCTDGVVTAGGLYTAPALPGTYTVSAQSVADGTKVGTALVTVVGVGACEVALATDHTQGLDTITVTAGTQVSTLPTAHYRLYTGASAGSVVTQLAQVDVAPLPGGVTVPFSFAGVPTAAPGTRTYYRVSALDSAPAPTEGGWSDVVSSVTSGQVATGQTYTQVFVASYGAEQAGLGAGLGYTVYDSVGAVLKARTAGLAENPGSGVYSAAVVLDYGWSGWVQLEDPTGGAPAVFPFGPVPVDGSAALPDGAGPAPDPNSLWGHLRDIRAVVVARSRPNPQDGLDFYDPDGAHVVLTQTFNDTIPPTARDESRPSG